MKKRTHIFLSLLLYYHIFWVESVLGSVAGVQMTTYTSSSYYPNTLMMCPTTEYSAWTCFKDSFLRKLNMSWSVPWLGLLKKKKGIIDLVVYQKQLGLHTLHSVLVRHIVYTVMMIHTRSSHLSTYNIVRLF